MSKSKELQLGKTNTLFIDGDRSNRYPKRDEFVDSGIMFLNSESIKYGYIDTSSVNFIDEKKYQEIKKGRIKKRDILLTTRGNGIGNIAFVNVDDRGLINAQMLILRALPSEIHPKFLYFYLRTKTLQSYINNFASGAAQPQIPITDLRKIPVRYPELNNQKKIAAILSAYDDLIENNKRRIALLEKMAEEIYREWFVRFRFPGHAKVKFVKGVPEGWDLLPFPEVVWINPPERVAGDDDKPYVGMENLSLTSMFFSYNETRKGNSGTKFRNHDVLFPRITPSLENGKRGYVMTLEDDQIGIGSTEFIVFREKVLGSEHIYLLANSSGFRKHAELSMAGASGRQRVKEDCFNYFLVNVPTKTIRDHFKEIVQPYFQGISVLSIANSRLSQTRDMLLPRLISGKLSVENLDIHFPPSMLEDAPQP